ncbi:MAG TPA: ATP-binding protein [Rhizomicrobium sp.]|jgi:signal transduction histidine kinase|nr:ATP-binding protein [Rhizomicrobium sp.]
MSFRNRLALFLMATLVCVQAATAIFAYAYLRQQVVEQGKRELSAAMQSLTRQIDFLSQRASDGVKVLALDYALRAAIARSDHNTELSVLRNHGRRIGAARMLLVRLDGAIAADTTMAASTGHAFPFPRLLGAAATGDRGTGLVTLADQIYWIVVVPVRAPVPIAFIAACIPLDNNLLDEMRRISSSRHAIILATKSASGRWNVAAHTSGGTGIALPPISTAKPGIDIVRQHDSEMLAIAAPLQTATGSRPIAAIIDYPLAEVLGTYRGLVMPMLVVLGLALLAAIGGATFIVRRFSRPLESVASAAQRIAAGDYSNPSLPTGSSDEIGHLARAIVEMTGAIAEREAALTGAMETAELARVEAVKANDAKSQFLANMSHELRTPLNAIVGFSEMIGQQVLGPVGTQRYVDYAQHIQDSGEHLRTLVERMLDLAQAHSGELAMTRDCLTASLLLREAMEIHRGFALQARVSLVMSPGADSARISGDALKLRQSFANIVHNAVKFTPRGGIVTITSAIEGAYLGIRVADTGAGISPDLLESVSKPFHRLRSALDGRHQGAGLGLAFARAVFELHGGSLALASKPGEGTIVSILLPLARPVISHAA